MPNNTDEEYDPSEEDELGEALYAEICKLQPDMAGKITGMILEEQTV